MSKRKEFKSLEGKNRKYVEDNQWPPLSYLKQLEDYEKTTGKTTGNGNSADSNNCTIS
jgi:Rho family protein